MAAQHDSIRTTPGSSYLDREGRRWWIQGHRPASRDELIVEAQLPGSYPRVDLYVMTEREFATHVERAGLRPERAGRAERPGGTRQRER